MDCIRVVRTILWTVSELSGQSCGLYQSCQDNLVDCIRAVRTILWTVSELSGQSCSKSDISVKLDSSF